MIRPVVMILRSVDGVPTNYLAAKGKTILHHIRVDDMAAIRDADLDSSAHACRPCLPHGVSMASAQDHFTKYRIGAAAR